MSAARARGQGRRGALRLRAVGRGRRGGRPGRRADAGGGRLDPPAGGRRRARRLRRRDRDPGRLSRAAPRLVDRRRGDEDGDRPRRTGATTTLGIDLVAMCADDVVCAGAEPLFFLDYVAVGRLDPERVAEIVGGVAAGCRLAGCALVGGETAEHPGLMDPDEVDLAGACIGRRGALAAASTGPRSGRATRSSASRASGLHANGFSLVRSRRRGRGLEPGRAVPRRSLRRVRRRRTPEPELAPATLGDVLLTPTRIYARAILDCAGDLEAAGGTRPPRPRPHHRRRPARQRAAGAAGRPRGAARPRPLADAVGHAADRRARPGIDDASSGPRSTAASG